jgi:hypothetical protein
MKRNLKALGISLVAVLATGAVAASAAHPQAEEADFAASEYPTHIQAAGHGTQQFETSIVTLSCEGASGTAALEEQSDTLTGENIEYSECDASGILPTTIDMNGCHYTFDAGQLTGAGKSTGAVKIEGCDNEAGITIGIYAPGSTSDDTTDLLCEIHVPEQTPTSGSASYEAVEEESTGKEAVTVEFEELTLHTLVAGTPAQAYHPSYICEEEEDTSSVLNGGFTATAENESNEAVDTTIEGT